MDKQTQIGGQKIINSGNVRFKNYKDCLEFVKLFSSYIEDYTIEDNTKGRNGYFLLIIKKKQVRFCKFCLSIKPKKGFEKSKKFPNLRYKVCYDCIG